MHANEFDFPERKKLAAFPLRCKREQEVQLTRSNRKSFTWHCCNDLNVLEGNELATHRNCKRSSCMNECLRHVAFFSQMVSGRRTQRSFVTNISVWCGLFVFSKKEYKCSQFGKVPSTKENARCKQRNKIEDTKC